MKISIRQLEVNWYAKHGKYDNRIKQDSNGAAYVIGDWAWNRNNPNKPEYIERQIDYGIRP